LKEPNRTRSHAEMVGDTSRVTFDDDDADANADADNATRDSTTTRATYRQLELQRTRTEQNPTGFFAICSMQTWRR